MHCEHRRRQDGPWLTLTCNGLAASASQAQLQKVACRCVAVLASFMTKTAPVCESRSQTTHASRTASWAGAPSWARGRGWRTTRLSARTSPFAKRCERLSCRGFVTTSVVWQLGGQVQVYARPGSGMVCDRRFPSCRWGKSWCIGSTTRGHGVDQTAQPILALPAALPAVCNASSCRHNSRSCMVSLGQMPKSFECIPDRHGCACTGI